ncbi:mannitol 2-dehydrogenase [Pseudonocardia cypriaca]|uniref:Mannitol-1-phosphate 5-dehydrogenase n=2 Tax=Pseudonocardia cypriaca TaxID=882449 RepID=A0A543GCD7_9PSEU|nr:mannitol 2-dehydrogenase [Pseudonocardia cypriaca]
MKLCTATLASARQGTAVPSYDRTTVRPGIVHIGMGNFHRAHQAVYLDRLLTRDPTARDFGLVGVNLLEQDERLARVMAGQDRLYTVLERHEDGTTAARIVGSIVDNLWAPDGTEPIIRALADPRTRIVTLTITEGGYCQDPVTGEVDLAEPGLQADLAHPRAPVTAFGYLAEGLRRRRSASIAPFTVLSCDNVIGNGDLARSVLLAFVTALDPGLAEWVATNVAFPNAMVDRITPRTSAADVDEAEAATGLRDDAPVPCEPFTQWVVEDTFPSGRPSWEMVGVQMVDDVRPFELMKLRLINAGHQTIAYAGALLGHEFGWQACADPTVRRLLQHYLEHEGIHTVGTVPGVDLHAYCDSVVERFSNPRIPDTMARLCNQSSTMLSTFLLPVARDLLRDGRDLHAVATVVACWTRFVRERRDEHGRPLELVDTRSDDLHIRATRDDPLALIRGNPIFAGLDDDPRFVEVYTRILHDMGRLGVRRAIDDVLASAA